MNSSSSNKNVTVGIMAALVAAGLFYYVLALKSETASSSASTSSKKKLDDGEDDKKKTEAPKSRSLPIMKEEEVMKKSSSVSESGDKKVPEKVEDLNKMIEEADKRGKELFKQKKFLEAATCFTEAVNLLLDESDKSKNSTAGFEKLGNSQKRQVITLLNNRSAMYEKAGMGELTLEDCAKILDMDISHEKARLRKLRVLESEKKWIEALQEICAIQLRFNMKNREQLRLGIPITPPIPQTKLEEVVNQIIPDQVAHYLSQRKTKSQVLIPSVYTILQLLQSFSGYNAWMAKAAKDGSIPTLSTELEELDDAVEDEELLMKRARILSKRGKRYAYAKQFGKAIEDFEKAYDIVDKATSSLETDAERAEKFGKENFLELLEWTGMCKHLKYELRAASQCYDRCGELDPNNAEVLVKRAGVKMDATDHEKALSLFSAALQINPSSTDALLHRANLYMLRDNKEKAMEDLQQAISLKPNLLLAHLRLATVHMAGKDLDAADECLKQAEQINPDSSEVHSYRGEMYFSQGDLENAKIEFQKAIECDAKNPTPYVNTALVLMNMPGPNGMPDLPQAISFLEQAIEIDPQFHAAYVHLGQLKLACSSNLTDARDVVKLYDSGLEKCCRSEDEVKDIVSMRVLAVAQIEAAASLKMETLNMQ